MHTQAVTAGLPMVWQVAPVPQTTPQAPQLKSSLVVLTHDPAHAVGRVWGRLHTLAVQTPPMRQA